MRDNADWHYIISIQQKLCAGERHHWVNRFIRKDRFIVPIAVIWHVQKNRLFHHMSCRVSWAYPKRQIFPFTFPDVLRHPSSIPAWCQEPLLVRGICRKHHLRPVQDKLVRSLLLALSHHVPALEEHFPGTLDSPWRQALPHAVPSVFLYHWSAKVRHHGPVWQTEAAPRRQVHHFQGATLVDTQTLRWVDVPPGWSTEKLQEKTISSGLVWRDSLLWSWWKQCKEQQKMFWLFKHFPTKCLPLFCSAVDFSTYDLLVDQTSHPRCNNTENHFCPVSLTVSIRTNCLLMNDIRSVDLDGDT